MSLCLGELDFDLAEFGIADNQSFILFVQLDFELLVLLPVQLAQELAWDDEYTAIFTGLDEFADLFVGHDRNSVLTKM